MRFSVRAKFEMRISRSLVICMGIVRLFAVKVVRFRTPAPSNRTSNWSARSPPPVINWRPREPKTIIPFHESAAAQTNTLTGIVAGIWNRKLPLFLVRAGGGLSWLTHYSRSKARTVQDLPAAHVRPRRSTKLEDVALKMGNFRRTPGNPR